MVDAWVAMRGLRKVVKKVDVKVDGMVVKKVDV